MTARKVEAWPPPSDRIVCVVVGAGVSSSCWRCEGRTSPTHVRGGSRHPSPESDDGNRHLVEERQPAHSPFGEQLGDLLQDPSEFGAMGRR